MLFIFFLFCSCPSQPVQKWVIDENDLIAYVLYVATHTVRGKNKNGEQFKNIHEKTRHTEMNKGKNYNENMICFSLLSRFNVTFFHKQLKINKSSSHLKSVNCLNCDCKVLSCVESTLSASSLKLSIHLFRRSMFHC